MTAVPGIGLLNTSDPGARDTFEQALYHAYAVMTDNRPTRLLWDTDDAGQRMHMSIPYTSLLIYTWAGPDGQILAYLAVNLDPGQHSQAARYGFGTGGSVPVPTPCCEILTLMRTAVSHTMPGASLFYRFVLHCFDDLVTRGFADAYATCGQKVLPVYRRLGARQLAHTDIVGHPRYLLHWPLTDLTSPHRTGSSPSLRPVR